MTYLADLVGYDYEILVFLGGLILALILFGAVIGYPIYLGIKRGLNAAVVGIISYIIAVIVAAVIGVVLVATFSGDSSDLNPQYRSDVLY